MNEVSTLVFAGVCLNAGLTEKQSRVARVLLNAHMPTMDVEIAYSIVADVVSKAKLHTGDVACTVCYDPERDEQGEALLCYGPEGVQG